MPDSDTPPDRRPPEQPRALMLGLGWFPESIGGLDRYYRSLLESLPDARGVVLGPANGAPGGVRAVCGPESSLARRLLAYRRAARQGALEADLLDAHFALYSLLPLLSRATRSLPRVFHFHGPWAEENRVAGDTSAVRMRIRLGIERCALRRTDAVIVLSSAFRRTLVERYGLAPWEINVWGPGVELEHFTPGDRAAAREHLGLERDTFVVVCARRMVARMGIDLLLDAWGELADSLPRGSVLLLVGDGPLADHLARRASRAPLAGSVRMLGRVPEADLPDVYRSADLAVVPTLSFEGFGLVVIEAAACGTPSIVSDAGGLPEAVAALDPSLTVPADDRDALAARIRAAADGELPDRARTRLHAERFRWQPVAQKHLDLYRRLIDGRHDERPRVVFLDHVARLSGGEIALLRLLPHLLGVNAHVILAEDGPLAARLQAAGVSVEVMALAASARDMRKDRVGLASTPPAAVLQTLLYTVRLALRLRRLAPDVVHTNSLKSGVYGALAARAVGVPVVWHLRDRIAEDYLPRFAVRLIRACVGRLPNAVIANSQATLETVGNPRRGRIHEVIPDSVQPSVHPPPRTSGEPVGFGMLGRIAPWKGQELFLRAFASAFPDGEERAIVVGAPMFGEEDYERLVHGLAVELGLGGRVEFRGFREDIWSELARLDVLVHASTIPEPFGQVVLEGMAAGLPVLAPDEGGPLSVIEHGRTGLLFASRDQAALATSMQALRDDPELRVRLGSAAQEAIAAYRPEALAERLQSLYARLCDSTSRRSTR